MIQSLSSSGRERYDRRRFLVASTTGLAGLTLGQGQLSPSNIALSQETRPSR